MYDIERCTEEIGVRPRSDQVRSNQIRAKQNWTGLDWNARTHARKVAYIPWPCICIVAPSHLGSSHATTSRGSAMHRMQLIVLFNATKSLVCSVREDMYLLEGCKLPDTSAPNLFNQYKQLERVGTLSCWEFRTKIDVPMIFQATRTYRR